VRRGGAIGRPGEEDHAAIELAFSKKKIEDRKLWLASFVPGTFLDQSVDQITYSDFVNKVPFVLYDLGPPILLCAHTNHKGQSDQWQTYESAAGGRGLPQ